MLVCRCFPPECVGRRNKKIQNNQTWFYIEYSCRFSAAICMKYFLMSFQRQDSFIPPVFALTEASSNQKLASMLSAAPRRKLFKALHNSTMEMLHINVAFWSVYSHFRTLLASRPQPGDYYLDEFTQTHQKSTLDFDCVDLTATNAIPHFRKLNENPRSSFFFRGKKKIFVILTWSVLPCKHLKMKQKQIT